MNRYLPGVALAALILLTVALWSGCLDRFLGMGPSW